MRRCENSLPERAEPYSEFSILIEIQNDLLLGQGNSLMIMQPETMVCLTVNV